MRAITVCILLALVPSAGLAQSLGDAAQRERARRRQVEASGAKARVITDSDLRDGRPAGETAPKTDTGASAPAQAGDAGRPAGSGPHPPVAARMPDDGDRSDADDRRDQEDEWRDRMQQARNRIERARRRYDYLATLVMVPGKYYVDPESGRAVIRSIEQLQQLTAEAKTDLEAAEQALADLEENARRAGVPPGWLR